MIVTNKFKVDVICWTYTSLESYLPRIRRPSEPENSRDFFAKYCDSSRTGLSISILFPNIFDVNYVGARVKLALETCTVGKRHCKHARWHIVVYLNLNIGINIA